MNYYNYNIKHDELQLDQKTSINMHALYLNIISILNGTIDKTKYNKE